MNTPIPLNLSELLNYLQIPKANQLAEAQRIFHGRGHAYKNLNHITIDWIQPLLLITLFAPIIQKDLECLAKELKQKFFLCKSIQVQHRYQATWLVECIYGKSINQLEITENKLRYKLKIKSGENTGLFLDMKNGREWVQKNSEHRRVLNLFSYTCGFSIAATAGCAKSVYNIDMRSTFLQTGRENHRLNNHSLESIRFEKLNIFKSFGRIKKHAPYDLIICDPPTFQKGSVDLTRDYPKLVRRLVDFTSDDAYLFLCINTPHIGSFTGKEFLLDTVEKNAPNLTLVDEIKSPTVYKDTQDKGTKILIFKV